MIPQFTAQGVLPPYVGSNGPGGAPADMAPYPTSSLEVCHHFGFTPKRLQILDGWLRHRDGLRKLGFQGFQWIDGSFVEDKIPNDIDVVTFFRPPADYLSDPLQFMKTNAAHFDRDALKKSHFVDTLWVDLSVKPESLVSQTRYWFGLFTHRRGDDLWKGMLQVPLADNSEAGAANFVASALSNPPGGNP